jgi:hypothetical protein
VDAIPIHRLFSNSAFEQKEEAFGRSSFTQIILNGKSDK